MVLTFIQDTNKILTLPAVIIWEVLDSVQSGTMVTVHLVLDVQLLISMEIIVLYPDQKEYAHLSYFGSLYWPSFQLEKNISVTNLSFSSLNYLIRSHAGCLAWSEELH